MTLTVVNSGSKGNCYVLHNGSEALMIEAGVPFKEVLQTVGVEVAATLKGCILTHEHQDHSKFVKDVLDHAIPVYATSGTIGALKGRSSQIMKPRNFWLNHDTDNELTPWQPFMVGSFTVLPFRTVHDAMSPCGFFINHAEFGNLLFATDTRFIPSTFKDLNNIMIECNYHPRLLYDRNDIPDSLKERIKSSHQSIDTCCMALEANDLTHVNMVMLIHISEMDGNPALFREVVQQSVGPGHTVEVAERHKNYEMAIAPF